MRTQPYLLTALLCIGSRITTNEAARGFYRNVQVASGSSVVFPKVPAPPPVKGEIPLDILLRMNDVADTKEFIENFVYPDMDNATLTKITSRVGYEGFERSSTVVKAKMAVCIPELQTVPVRPQNDSKLYYHPSCIRIERCGGCCAHSLLACTAVESEIVNVGVIVAEYRGGDRLVYRNYLTIPVEKHTKCKCDCRIQPENCTASQKYNKKKCSCECNNPDSEKKCNSDYQTRIWNKDRCACLCREQLECSTGYYFDAVSCRCEVNEGRRRQNPKPWIA